PSPSSHRLPMSLLSSFYCYRAHRVLHSFPTRRSSDLLWLVWNLFDHLLFLHPADVSWHDVPERVGAGTGSIFKKYWQRFFIDGLDRKSTRLNSSHVKISYAVFCLKKKKQTSLDISCST